MTIILIEGPDNSGKTTIAKELSVRSGIDYYKFPKQNEAVQNLETRMITRYASTFFADFIHQVKVNCILDRHYPTELVYARALNREFDYEVIRYIDSQFAKANVALIMCIKRSYQGYHDDIIPDDYVQAIVQGYKDFLDWTIIRNILLLDTTDQNLESQMLKIGRFLRDKNYG